MEIEINVKKWKFKKPRVLRKCFQKYIVKLQMRVNK